jgi:hypothetical protein
MERKMKINHWILSGVLAGALVCGGVILAQAPGVDVDAHRHPDLADAQHHIQEAYGEIEKSQEAHKDQLGGHAEKARDLLAEASREVKAAAEYADHH